MSGSTADEAPYIRVCQTLEAWEVDESGPLAFGWAVPSSRIAQGLPPGRVAPISEERAHRAADALDELARALGDPEDFNGVLLQAQIRRRAHFLRLHAYALEITPYRSFVHTAVSALRSLPLQSSSERDEFLALLAAVGRTAHDLESALRENLQTGCTVHRLQITPISTFLRSVVADPEKAPFMPEAAAADFRACCADVIRRHIAPKFHALADFLEQDYAAKAPEGVGMAVLPGGSDAYPQFVRYWTSLSLSPEAIHDIGLRQVEQCEELMAALRLRMGKRDKMAFHHELTDGGCCRPKSPEEIGEKLSLYASRADAVLDRLFATRIKTPYTIERLPSSSEGTLSFGFYQMPTPARKRGTYFYNGAHLERRSLLWMGALALHEIVPGHHLQICATLENDKLPTFRRQFNAHNYIGAFAEGWAEYAAELGSELDLYETDLERYGRAATDMAVCARLVVDTGMNALGWTRDHAQSFMREHTLLSEEELATETLRYSTDLPGQALSYKLGMLAFTETRRRTARALGSRFDIRDYHSVLVRCGQMPLDLMDVFIDRYIESAASR